MKRGRPANQPRQRYNPNLADYDRTALKVPCPYCKAKAGVQCWTLRSWHGEPSEITHLPHKSRLKLAWRCGPEV
jgi:hypothetical protein